MRALSAWGSSVFVRLGLTCYALLPPLRASRRAQLSNQDAACKRAIWLEGNWLLCVAPATAAYDDGVAEYTPEVVLLNRRHVQPIGPDNAELLSHFATARGLGTGKEKMQNWYDCDMNNKTVQKWFMRPLLTDKTAYKAMASKIVHLQHAAPKAPSDANDDGDDDVNMLTGAQAAAAAAKTPGSSRARGMSTRPKLKPAKSGDPPPLPPVPGAGNDDPPPPPTTDGPSEAAAAAAAAAATTAAATGTSKRSRTRP